MSRLLTQLGDLGAHYRDPVQAIDWDAVDLSLPWLPTNLLSLAGQDLQKEMPPEMLRRFSQIEFARLCAAGLWLENLLISRVTADGFLNADPREARVILQEVREEAGHGLMFVEMITRAGLTGVPLLGRTGFLTWVARRLDPKSAEFWAMVYIGESVTDNLALRALRATGDRICPTARQVLLLHHKDEARHIATARALLKARLSSMSPLRRRRFAWTLRFLLRHFLKAAFYPSAASLAALGLAQPEAVARAAAKCPARRRLAEACAAPALKALGRDMLAPAAAAWKPAPSNDATPTPVFVGSDIYRRPAYGNNHPLAISRTATVMELCKILGWLGDGSFRDSPQASTADLGQFHRPDYIAALRQVDESGRATRESRERYALGTMENPVFPGVYQRAATSVGGSILAAELAIEGRIAYHPAGGTHHGRPDKASGFCYFNDPVIAIQTLLKRGLERIYYVDLDAHFGDGVQDAFANDDRVFTLSIHEAERWPYRGALDDRAGGWARNLPVPKGFHDSELDHLVTEAVLPLGTRFAPEAVVITCGADGLAGDPLSGMELSNLALWQAVEQLAALSPRTLVLGGGGYNPWTVARCWTGLWGRLRGRDVFSPLPGKAQDLMRGLTCDLVESDEVPEAWHTSLADSPNPGAVRGEVAALVPAVLAA
jgi:acetoin utilization protein AcuC